MIVSQRSIPIQVASPQYELLHYPSQEPPHAQKYTNYKHGNKMNKYFHHNIFFINSALNGMGLGRIATDNSKMYYMTLKNPL
jgi:hypothetical protein